MQFKVGASRMDEEICEELFCKYKENKIEYMETEATSLLNDGGKTKRLAEKYGIKLWSAHLPFCPFDKIDISSTDEEKRKFSVEHQKKIISKIAENGIDKAVIHPSAEPIAEEERPCRMSAAKKSLFELAEFAKGVGVVIAVEDLPRTCLGRNSGEIAELISVHTNLKVCFDTNHLLSENPIDFIKRLNKDIVTVHVSDYDFVNERHWLPKEGMIKWDELIEELDKCGYGGIWMYEVNPEKYLTKIYDNACELLKK